MDASQLSRKQQITAASKLLGFHTLPVTVDEFIESEYYLGKTYGNGQLYPYWKKKLMEIFPDEIHTAHNYIILTGAIGSGKSTFSRICAMYLEHRLDCLSNLKAFGLAKGKKVQFNWFHTSAGKAHTDFIQPLDTIKDDSDYFSRSNMAESLPTAHVVDGPRSNNGIGGDVIFYNLSEINFVNYDVAVHKMNSAFKRFTSRFELAKPYLGLVVLDTSAQGDASVVEDFLADNPYETYLVRASTWEAKAHLNMYFQYKGLKDGYRDFYYIEKNGFKCGPYELNGIPDKYKINVGEVFRIDETMMPDDLDMVTDFDALQSIAHDPLGFWCYSGDSILGACIITDKEPIVPEMDKDRLLFVPIELYADFKFDITTALQDQAGISTTSTGKFLPDNKEFRKSLKLPMYHKPIEIVDFNDFDDSIIEKLKTQLQLVPKDRVISVAFDIGVTKDICGIAISYLEGYKLFEGTEVRFPIIVTPVAIGLSRRKGQETSISHLYRFILDLEKEFEVGGVFMDSFASRQLLQDLERSGVRSRYKSVDRTDEAYLFFKRLFNAGHWSGPMNKVLEKEVCELMHVDNKVDHPATGTKDISDAVCCSVHGVYENIELFEVVSKIYRSDLQLSVIKSLQQNELTVFEDAMQNYWSTGQ